MLFAHDTEAALLAAVALVNSAEEPDTLTTVGELDAFYREHLYTGSRTHDRVELDQVRALRAPLRDLLTSSRHDAVAIVNRMLADETAMAMVDVIRADEMSRLGVCADDGCGGVVLDLSRNRSKRFCSPACSNRNAVAAYRARQAKA